MRVVVNASLLSLLLLNNAVYALAAPDDPAVQQYRAVGVNLWCREDNPVACYDDNQPAPRAVEENTTRLRDLITSAIARLLTSPEASGQTIAQRIESIQRWDLP